MLRLIVVIAVLLALGTAAFAQEIHVTTFQELMDPAVFPDPQFGMKVDGVKSGSDWTEVTTTGATFRIDGRRGEITCTQRIDHRRVVAVANLGKALSGMKVTHKGPGLARITFQKPGITIRVNGDSLLMLQVHDPLKVSIDRRIIPVWKPSWKSSHVVVDEWGGFSLFCSEYDLKDGFDPKKRTVATYNLPKDAVLCVGVCPPKPYDWERSFRDQIVHTWAPSAKHGYPANNMIQIWRSGGNILLLQGELSQWVDWNRDFTPVNGEAEFKRVRDRCEEMNVKMMVYTSPFYYYGGMDRDGQPTDGRNMQFFLKDITNVMTKYKPHGLYYDGQYPENPAALYALARHSRAIVGETGLLEWHSTFEVGWYEHECCFPQADAYIDFQFRGEGTRGRYTDRNYFRFFVSCYNVSNCIGALCNNIGEQYLPPSQMEDVIRSNCRVHTMLDISVGIKPGGGYGGDENAIMEHPGVLITPAYIKYWSSLNDSLKDKFLKDIDARQAALKEPK